MKQANVKGCGFPHAFKIIALALVVALPLLTPARQAHAAEIARVQPPAPPSISADAAYVTDMTSGTELFALNPDEPLPPASLTKIAAALVILDEANLDDQIEIVDDDLVSPEESQVGLVAGDRLSVRDLLIGMLVPSGNDATRALARYVGERQLGGTPSPEQAVAEFVSMMNAKAAALGAASSHFANPTGIDAPGHVMTARDIAILTEAALQNSLFAEIVSTPRAVLHSEVRPDGYAVTTTNTLLLEGVVTGVKTGTTPKAGGCLVTTFAVGPNQVIAVVLGSDLSETADGQQDSSARFADTRALLDATSQDYVWLDPGVSDTIAGLSEELRVWDVTLGNAALLPVPADSASAVRYRLVLGPPSTSEETAGEVQFFVGDRLLSQRPAVQAS
jgi:D-alanyl-D-alanine carboxypeptidase (penicillin-binding protein 5/6)